MDGLVIVLDRVFDLTGHEIFRIRFESQQAGTCAKIHLLSVEHGAGKLLGVFHPPSTGGEPFLVRKGIRLGHLNSAPSQSQAVRYHKHTAEGHRRCSQHGIQETERSHWDENYIIKECPE